METTEIYLGFQHISALLLLWITITIIFLQRGYHSNSVTRHSALNEPYEHIAPNIELGSTDPSNFLELK